ncbi:hypothetical protein EK21DRAFT_70967 [Setomelanomma holmii]|uniref:Uncharacterized protein n=1 Tax=Setomelanomma holmii TaxID=210430 RepID=A0A9P4H582_9PLEO|nr:hypothetical protein EK21DRAFT_70967 [Setomelanomma holmii]
MDEEEDLDIAAAMGFSSFGGVKKRKYDQTNSPKTPSVMDASGANSTELGVRPKKASKPTSKAKKAPQPTGLADFLARGQTIPDKPQIAPPSESVSSQHDLSASEMVSFGGSPISKAELNALRIGVKDKNGDTAYFLPSFIEDPWEKLKGGK